MQSLERSLRNLTAAAGAFSGDLLMYRAGWAAGARRYRALVALAVLVLGVSVAVRLWPTAPAERIVYVEKEVRVPAPSPAPPAESPPAPMPSPRTVDVEDPTPGRPEYLQARDLAFRLGVDALPMRPTRETGPGDKPLEPLDELRPERGSFLGIFGPTGTKKHGDSL